MWQNKIAIAWDLDDLVTDKCRIIAKFRRHYVL